jgi:hypothetical protein
MINVPGGLFDREPEALKSVIEGVLSERGDKRLVQIAEVTFVMQVNIDASGLRFSKPQGTYC